MATTHPWSLVRCIYYTQVLPYHVLCHECTSIYVVCTYVLNSDDGLMFTNERVMCKMCNVHTCTCKYIVHVYSAYYL